MMEYDYLNALYEHFVPDMDLGSEELTELDRIYSNLMSRLSREDNLLLHQLTDQEYTIRDQETFRGFVEGFKLGSGLLSELRQHSLYDFKADMLDRARKAVISQ